MADPEKLADSSEFQRIAKATADLEQTVSAYREYMDAHEQLTEAKQMLRESDGAMPFPVYIQQYFCQQGAPQTVRTC